jgi:hypothetical protein
MNNFRPKILSLLTIACVVSVASNGQLRTSENVPVHFYGKVVDQSGQPVEGAKISLLMVISLVEQYDTATQPVTLQTDQKGNFTLAGYTAYGITKITVAKEGYELSKKTILSYKFGIIPTYTPDPKNPVVFRMWKKAGNEKLISSAWRGKVACDGTTNRFDLVNGSQGNDGNLKITCTRTPLNYERTNGPSFAYKFEITLTDGSIQATEDEFTYLAPETGYRPSVTIERKPGDPQWRAGVDQEFYVKTADGHYGRIFVTWDAGHRPSPTILKWDCSINPTGSRNLER